MTKLLKNESRLIIHEFAKEIESAKIRTDETEIIDFRDDVSKENRRPVYKIPTSYLRFRKDNGRIASDVLTYENSTGALSETTDYAQAILRQFLERKDPEKTAVLKKEIRRDGQREVAVATADGFLINGNRRKMVLESLQQEFPDEERFKYLKLIILPGLKDNEDSPTIGEIEKIENKYQLQVLGKAEYYNFDKALTFKRKIDLGISLEEQLADDPNFYELSPKRFERKMQKVKDEYLETLEAIDRYLYFFDRVGHYNTISEGRSDTKGRWQAFRDYHNSTYKRMEDSQVRKKLGLRTSDVASIENVAFKIIRLRDLGELGKKVHVVMRDLIKIAQNEDAKVRLFLLKGKKGSGLRERESVDENGKPLDERTKDIIWSKKYGHQIISTLVDVYEIFEKRKRADSPVKSLETILKRLEGPSFDFSSNDGTNLSRIQTLLRKIKKRVEEIEKQTTNN